MSKNLDMALLLDIYGDMLTEKQKDTLTLYYDEDLSLTEIAENTGITRQGVHKCIRSAEDYLMQLEDTLEYAAKSHEINEILKKMKSIIESSADKNSEENKKLLSCVDEIEEII
ncbi:MAG: hypothetical protein E7490_06770 [Ruminococcaceae bacterium]|nr:hypothetical protein [Oscillospiraceae bacterium]